ncbi:Eco57I restriction-modification methylase domain-containing protein [Chloracidobacterium validum]|uniref:Eco57I restriction-modification methylase domain-containing protein n=1 Tax=Chloracidobacterium validum TaxID=2821543 RepID=UPI0031B842F9
MTPRYSSSPAGPLAALLDLPVLNGALFAPSAFDTCRLTNRDLLAALRFLDSYQESDKGATRRVNYAALDVEELGSVYESLLDYHPNIPTTAGRLHFELKEGFERKGTGSYYTPPELVAELISSALAPVVAERLAQLPPTATPEEKAQALLALRVIDPACGSGHFLLAAARWLGRKLAGIRVGTDEPPPEAVRAAIREVVTHSIYGVDKNPLAVELCRVALWIESYCAGKPLTFLDHRIRCGNSLVGVFDLAALKQGVPDEAFSPGPDDTKSIAAELKKRNRQQRGGQRSFFAAFDAPAEVAQFSKAAQALNAVPDDTPQDIRRKMERYEALSAQTARDRLACDLWTAAFFQRFTPGAPPITTETVWDALEATSAHGQVVGQARALAEQLGFFHWPLAFPEVFAQGGFDVVLSNPPWERIKLQEKEFFKNEDATIANAKHKAERARLMAELEQRNLSLWRNYRQTLHIAEATSKFLRRGERFPLTGHGDVNTYSVFAELAWQLLASHGQAGIVVPTGIATDDTNKYFFGAIVKGQNLVSLFDFENREKLFTDPDSRTKFALLTLSRAAVEQATYAFFCTRADQLHENARCFTLSPDDLALLNPNTRTLPVFRTRADAELTKAIYRRVPVLVNETTNANPWGVKFQVMFHMSNDSHRFRSASELQAQGFHREGSRFVRGETVYLPLYEAKLIWQFDHRFATYDEAGKETRDLTIAEKSDPATQPLPRYWVEASEVNAKLSGWQRRWLLGFRDVTNATNERTAIFSLLPRVAVGHTNPLVLSETVEATDKLLVCLAAMNSLVFDFITRQKVGGTHLTFTVVKQLPVLPPNHYTPTDLRFIVPRTLELVYTAWDLAPFAADLWHDADEPLRAAIDQWRQTAPTHPDTPPPWLKESHPFPPFQWDADRRAVLRAELDAYYAHLYGLTRKQLRYILDPADLTKQELANILDPTEEVTDPLDPEGYARRVKQSDFPGETFRVLKDKEQRHFGEYRTRRLTLEAWAVVGERGERGEE